MSRLRAVSTRRLARTERICGSDMFNFWKPLIPAGVEGTWAPVKESGRRAWCFNSHYPRPDLVCIGEEQIRGLTFGTVSKEQRRESRRSWSRHEVVASLLILAAIVGEYLYFSG